VKVVVKLIGSFADAAGFGEKEFDVPAGTTIDGVMTLLAIDRTRPMIVTRGGRAIGDGDAVAPGDRIAVAPVFSGG
jgi:molybdopterin converting factor small subunit